MVRRDFQMTGVGECSEKEVSQKKRRSETLRGLKGVEESTGRCSVR